MTICGYVCVCVCECGNKMFIVSLWLCNTYTERLATTPNSIRSATCNAQLAVCLGVSIISPTLCLFAAKFRPALSTLSLRIQLNQLTIVKSVVNLKGFKSSSGDWVATLTNSLAICCDCNWLVPGQWGGYISYAHLFIYKQSTKRQPRRDRGRQWGRQSDRRHWVAQICRKMRETRRIVLQGEERQTRGKAVVGSD